MGTDNLFKKRKAALKERAKERRTPKPNSYLIVSEGEKTEPFYFDGIANYINGKYGKSIDVEIPEINAEGIGSGTVKLVRETERLVSRSKVLYENIWVVFDKDDFVDFDDAIQEAADLGFNVAWSNQSFEFWIYLHFNYCDSALHRDGWVEKLDEIFKTRGIDAKGYAKNNPDIFEIVRTNGSIKHAVSSAMRIEQVYPEGSRPSKQDPCTTVHHLILKLKPYMTELF